MLRATTYISFLLASTLTLLLSCTEETVSRRHESLNNDWLFCLTDTAFAYEEDYDDSDWRLLNLPHDWSIEANFTEKAPAGAEGGALPGGVGWYRKKIEVTQEDLRGRVLLQFDGIYRDATVFVNQIKEGRRPSGYTSVTYDITSDLHVGENIIAVKVDNSLQPNARWYTGSGIYRNVWLTRTGLVHVAPNGTCIRTPLVNDTKANVEIVTTVMNDYDLDVDVDVKTILRDSKGKTVGVDVSTVHVEGNNSRDIVQDYKIMSPKVWDIDNPELYTCETSLFVRGHETDRTDSRFGIRSFYFDAEVGLVFNDKHVKLNGVCLHDDLGSLGSAVNKRAIERRLQMLKEMGCNAIRCTHNPPAPELLDLCDEMGFLVIDEAFDVWHLNKNDFDYGRYFDQWSEKDLTAMVLRDRNHPSIIMWSIGNEVLEQWDDYTMEPVYTQRVNGEVADSSTVVFDHGYDGVSICRRLTDIVHRYDPTRLVTAANNNAYPDNNLFKANTLDIIGFNYNNDLLDSVPKMYRGKPFLITESNSALMTRGYYKNPSTTTTILPEGSKRAFKKTPIKLAPPLCSSYDNCRTPWGTSHERTLKQVRDNEFVAGQFVWTGFDYLGEPTPYGWPARSSYFGIIDLAGLPKDVYYLYQSEWQTKKTVLHLFPHWNWKTGEYVDMWCYYNNADEVELYVNGKSAGIQTKTEHQLHALWRVKFEPGEVRVVSRRNGRTVAERTIATADRPSNIRLTADRKKIHADGNDICYITVEVVDSKGNLCPNAQNEIFFEAEGAADVESVDNGCQYSMEPFKTDHRRAFYGKCVVILKSNGLTGNVRLVAKSEGLKTAEITVNCLDDITY